MNHLLPLLAVSTIFERFNIFLEPLDFSLKLSLILLPIVGLILLIKRKLTFNPTFLFPFLAAVLVVEILSIFFSYDRVQSFQVVVFHLLMIGLFYLFVWSLTPFRVRPYKLSGEDEITKGSDPITSVICGWLAGALVVALYGFWQFWRYLQGQSPAIFLDEILGAKSLPAATFIHQAFGRTLLRPSSTFIDTNTAASFVGIAILLGLGFLLAAESKRQRLFLISVLITSLIFFVLSFSRSAILGLGVGLIVFAVLNLWEKISKPLLIGATLIFLLALLGGVGWLSFAKIRAVSNALRVEYAQGALQMLKHNPLLGIGVGNFEPYYTEVLRPTKEAGYSHSIFLTWLGEMGILGLLANLGLIGVVILFLGRESRKHQVGTLWRLRLTVLLSAFVALVTANIFHAHLGLEFTWVLLGLCVSGYYMAKSERQPRPPSLHSGVAGGKAKGKMSILGIGVDNVTAEEAVARVKGVFKAGKKAYSRQRTRFPNEVRGSYIVTPNPEMVMLARSDPVFAKILNEADLAIPDGIGLVWASRIFGAPLKERVSGTDLFLELCAEAARREGRVFLLGGGKGVAKRAAQELKTRYPKLRIAGASAGDGTEKGDKETAAAIKKAGPVDLLFVAYGHGKQERWIKRNLKKVPVKVAMGVGGAFDFVAGEVLRAPRVIRRLGLEWLFRLIRQPWRIRRQLALIPFAALVFKEALLDF